MQRRCRLQISGGDVFIRQRDWPWRKDQTICRSGSTAFGGHGIDGQALMIGGCSTRVFGLHPHRPFGCAHDRHAADIAHDKLVSPDTDAGDQCQRCDSPQEIDGTPKSERAARRVVILHLVGIVVRILEMRLIRVMILPGALVPRVIVTRHVRLTARFAPENKARGSFLAYLVPAVRAIFVTASPAPG